MKFETYREYDPRGIALAESAFITVWASLGSFHEDLVLVGGLVPKYLCGDKTRTANLPLPATLDVDIGIALAASAGQYGSISMDLAGQGFRMSEQYIGRFEKNVEGFSIYIDFLVERPGASEGAVAVDDIRANILPGINRALAMARKVTVDGTDLHGANQHLVANICEVGPFLVMKLRAFTRRQQPKDAFDILYTILNYDGGSQAAIDSIIVEREAGNPAFSDALKCLQIHFENESSPAPVKAAYFLFGEQITTGSEDRDIQRLQIQQQMVDAGRLMLSALKI